MRAAPLHAMSLGLVYSGYMARASDLGSTVSIRRPLVLAVSRETMRRHERPRIVHGSAADYYFAQFVTGQEEFQALETVKEFFQAPIVEDLLRLAVAAVGYQQSFGILNTE